MNLGIHIVELWSVNLPKVNFYTWEIISVMTFLFLCFVKKSVSQNRSQDSNSFYLVSMA